MNENTNEIMETDIDEIKNKSFKKGALYGALIVVCIIAAFLISCKIFIGNADALSFANYIRMLQVERTVKDNYRGDIDSEMLSDYTIKGYVAGLGDPYANFIGKSELDDYNKEVEGTYSGIGVIMSQSEENADIVVSAVYKSSSAEKAGIKSGDIITKVNNKSVKGYTLSRISKELIGNEEGKKVDIEIKRDGKLMSFSVKVEKISIPSIRHEVIEGIGYIHILEFTDDTVPQFKKALKALKKENVSGLIIDLRDDGGGIVQSACAMLNELLPKGTIITEKNNKNEVTNTYKSEGKSKYEKPIVVLINGETASSSEIFAGALKDNDMCTLVGEKTFGKGIMQTMYTLSDKTVLKITTSEWFLPHLGSIHKKGLSPDIEIANPKKDGKLQEIETMDRNEDVQLKKAIEVMKEKVEGKK